jgi:hypothetical protein
VKTDRLVTIFGSLLLLVAFGAYAPAQDGKGQQIVRLKGGGFVAFKTTTEPLSKEEFSFSSAEIDSNIVHRVLIDKSGTFYFGYDLEVEPLLAARQFQVRVLPLSREFEEQLRARKNFKAKPVGPDSKLSRILQSSKMETLGDGDAVALDVLVNPDTQVKIVDLISVSYDYLALNQEPVSDAPARDYTLSDVELEVSSYRLLINGELVTGNRPTGGCRGAIIWFYIPGKGRFIFSLSPHEGYDFRKSGSIEHNKIVFNVGSDRYEWVSNGPIVGSGGNWNLWVLQDPSYVSEFITPDEPATDVGTTAKENLPLTLRPEPKTTAGAANPKAEAFDQVSSEESKEPKQSKISKLASAASAIATSPPRRLLRLIFGAADRIESLLPRN